MEVVYKGAYGVAVQRRRAVRKEQLRVHYGNRGVFSRLKGPREKGVGVHQPAGHGPGQVSFHREFYFAGGEDVSGRGAGLLQPDNSVVLQREGSGEDGADYAAVAAVHVPAAVGPQGGGVLVHPVRRRAEIEFAQHRASPVLVEIFRSVQVAVAAEVLRAVAVAPVVFIPVIGGGPAILSLRGGGHRARAALIGIYTVVAAGYHYDPVVQHRGGMVYPALEQGVLGCPGAGQGIRGIDLIHRLVDPGGIQSIAPLSAGDENFT